MALLMAAKYPERIHSTLLIGPGVNQCMDDDIYESIVSSLDKEVRTEELPAFLAV